MRLRMISMFFALSGLTKLRTSGVLYFLLITSSFRLNNFVNSFSSREATLDFKDYQTDPGRRSGSRAVQPIFFISKRPSSLTGLIGESPELPFGSSKGGGGGGGRPREPTGGGGGGGRELRDPVLSGGGGGGGGGRSVPDWILGVMMLLLSIFLASSYI